MLVKHSASLVILYGGDRKYKYSLDNTFTRVFQVIYHCCINDCSVLILSVLSVFPTLGQETSGVSSPGNPS